jgi:hypothetical protein
VVTTVCAQCGSRLRPEDSWCSLCLALAGPLEPAEPAESAVLAEPSEPAEPEPSEPAPSTGSVRPPAPRSPGVPPDREPPVAAAAEAPEEAGPGFELPSDWEDGVVVTGARQKVERRAQALASADQLIAELVASENATRRATRFGALQYDVAERTGLTPSRAALAMGVAGGVTLLLALMVVLTLLGLLL